MPRSKKTAKADAAKSTGEKDITSNAGLITDKTKELKEALEFADELLRLTDTPARNNHLLVTVNERTLLMAREYERLQELERDPRYERLWRDALTEEERRSYVTRHSSPSGKWVVLVPKWIIRPTMSPEDLAPLREAWTLIKGRLTETLDALRGTPPEIPANLMAELNKASVRDTFQALKNVTRTTGDRDPGVPAIHRAAGPSKYKESTVRNALSLLVRVGRVRNGELVNTFGLSEEEFARLTRDGASA